MDISQLTISEIKNMLASADIHELPKLLSDLESDHRSGIKSLISSYHSRQKQSEAKEKTWLKMNEYETSLRAQGFDLVAGVDEVGRGSLAGPIVSAAVVLHPDKHIKGLRDSKMLSSKQREDLFLDIQETAVCINIARIENDEIDRYGMGWANRSVLILAIEGLNPHPDYVLSDGFPLHNIDFPSLAMIKGDSRSVSIAAASIVAKVTRDRIMVDYHEQYPQYCFDSNKGYGTTDHSSAIQLHGLCPLHRRSFAPCSMNDATQLSFD